MAGLDVSTDGGAGGQAERVMLVLAGDHRAGDGCARCERASLDATEDMGGRGRRGSGGT